MVAMYLGLNGDGKTIAGVRMIQKELETTQRGIVTNIPLELGELADYVHHHSNGRVQAAEVLSRITLLQQTQVRKFWLIRPDRWRMVDIKEEEYKNGLTPDLAHAYRFKDAAHPENERGIEDMLPAYARQHKDVEDTEAVPSALYIIDECQTAFPVRNWAKTPSGLMFYLSQHRKVGDYGDDVIFITQTPDQVEKVLKNLVMEYHVFRNLAKRRRLGFRLPGLFGFAVFSEPPGPLVPYMDVGTVRLDAAGLCRCYRTEGGVGLGIGQKADQGQKPKGKSMLWLILIIVAALAVIVALPVLATRFLRSRMSPLQIHPGGFNPIAIGTPPPAETNHLSPPALQPRSAPETPPQATRQEHTAPEPSHPDAKGKALKIAGVTAGEGGIRVALSDGTILGPESATFELGRDGTLKAIILDGKRVTW